ncbi:MAG: phage tail tape measure protein [Microbacterium sp.]|uniref:phage tail tape measure protein n=1 Tax=Microbacterium sp. TaxID=51671 RepID=UPI0025F7C3F0|nr:phage tail tape measure protein [Microbacterium sp.]MBQ9915952.1 phage tail tape measure protein [Microbacterium sp.]
MGNGTDLIIRLLVDDEDLDKVDRSQAKFDGWNDALGESSKIAAGTLIAIGGAAVGASIAYADAQAGVDNLAGSLGLVPDQAEAAGEAAANAYADAFGGSLEEVQATVGGIIGSIGEMRLASAEQIQDITEKVLTLSGTFGLEADRISQVVGQMLSTGMATSAEEGLDLLTVALQSVPAAVRGDILDAVDEYGPFFQQLGITGSQAMGALVDASSKGMYGIDKIGDAVKEFTIRSSDMSTTSQAAYAAAGLSASDMAAKILAGGEQGRQGLDQVIDGLLGIQDPVQRANAAIGLFGTPLEDLGTGEIPAFLESLQSTALGMGEVDGAARDMADQVSGNARNAWDGITRSFQMTVVEIGSSLAPAIDGVLGWLKDLATWAGENTSLVTALAGGAGVLAAAILVASAAFKGLMFLQTLGGLWAAFRVAQTGATAATVAQTAAQWANNAAWLASPVTWIILAIIVGIGLLVAAVIWLWQNWGAVTQWIGDAWNWLWTTILSPVFNAIGAVFTWIYQTIILPIVTGIMLYIGLWAAVITWLWETVVSPVLAWIGSGFVWLYENAVRPVVDWISAALQFLGLAVQFLWATYVQPALNAIGAGFQWVNSSIIQPTIGAIVGAVTWIGNTVRDVFGAIAGFMSTGFQAALGAVRGPVNGIIALVNSAIRGLNSISVSIPSWVPIVGGQTFSLGIPQVPYLATGGVTMGPMLAVVGDNPGGREYIEPVDRVASRMERVAIEASRGAGGGGPSGPMRIAREDLEYVARLIGETVYPLIVSGAQRQIKTALGV